MIPEMLRLLCKEQESDLIVRVCSRAASMQYTLSVVLRVDVVGGVSYGFAA